jgi:speckle-type POZ protein
MHAQGRRRRRRDVLHGQPVLLRALVPAFLELLHYIYTDSLADDYTVGRVVAVQHLLVAMDRYRLDRLMVLCEARLCGWIDLQSVATTLALAERFVRGILYLVCSMLA